MNIINPGVQAPVPFTSLAAAVQNSLLSPAGTRQVTTTDWGYVITQATNAGAVNVPVGGVTLCEANPFTVVSGRLYLVQAKASMAKGATGGRNQMLVELAPVAAGAAVWISGGNLFYGMLENMLATEAFLNTIFAVFRATASGTIRVTLSCDSLGSDSTCGIGNAQLGVVAI